MSFSKWFRAASAPRLSRRSFFRTSAVIGAGTALSAWFPRIARAQDPAARPPKPKTNVEDALKHPRTPWSMPGKFPGTVVEVHHPGSVTDNKPQAGPAYEMVKAGILSLTGAATLEEAWQVFVTPHDRVGLKLNPVAGKELSTSHEVTRAVIRQLKEAGIPEGNIVIWDRRLQDLEETGFTKEAYPGIRITGTEMKDTSGSFTDPNGRFYSEDMIDKSWFYWADVEGEYDAETMPYMVNGGKYSYFSKICTQELDKIINIPILKNAGASVTLCMKNLAYGAVTNTGRLHKELWSETTAEVCAFPPLRDKVVLNIVDGLIGCYQGGPGANPQFITDFKVMLFGTDPVAVDRVGYEIIYTKRVEEDIQKEESPRGREFMNLAQHLGLGTADLGQISVQKLNLT